MILPALCHPGKSFFPPIPVRDLPISQEISLKPASGVAPRYSTLPTWNESAVLCRSNRPHLELPDELCRPRAGRLFLSRSYGPNLGAYPVGRDFSGGGLVHGGRREQP